MPLEKVWYITEARTTGSRKNTFMKHLLWQLTFVTLLAAQSTANTVWAQAKAAPPIDGVIGKLQSFDGKSLDVQTASGVVHVIVKQPLTTYKQIPSDLSHVAAAPYIGVASTEQADGKQVAKQIFIFPTELSGAAEGSVLTDPPGETTHSRMTNGSVSSPSVSHSRRRSGERRIACLSQNAILRWSGCKSVFETSIK